MPASAGASRRRPWPSVPGLAGLRWFVLNAGTPMSPWGFLRPFYLSWACTSAWATWRMRPGTASAWTWKPNRCQNGSTAHARAAPGSKLRMNREVEIYVDLQGQPHLAGRLWSRLSKGREGASFAYDPAWLASPLRFPLEPALSLDAGSHHTKQGRSLFGALGDSAPDRWGRMLMKR